MPDIPRPTAFAGQMLALRLERLGPTARFDPAFAAFRFKLQGTSQWVRFGQFEPQDQAKAELGAAAFAFQHLRLLIVEEALVAQHGNRDQPIAPQTDDCGEQAETLDPR